MEACVEYPQTLLATHDSRAATERSPESADEIGSAARHGRRCGWRPSMMNEEEERHHRRRCFSLVFDAPKKSASRKPFIHLSRGPLVQLSIRQPDGSFPLGPILSSPVPLH
jgi:hypothetical protein